jgi:hypothetical protein
MPDVPDLSRKARATYAMNEKVPDIRESNAKCMDPSSDGHGEIPKGRGRGCVLKTTMPTGNESAMQTQNIAMLRTRAHARERYKWSVSIDAPKYNVRG